MKPDRLLRKRRPEKAESLLGYILRMTELNYYDKMAWILELAGFSTDSRLKAHNEMLYTECDLTKLAKLTATKYKTLQRMQYRPTNTKAVHLFFDLPLKKYMIQSQYPKICPFCLKENGYINMAWELAMLTCCPIHRCMLVRMCTSCGKQITWNRRQVSICKCGFDFREGSTQSVNNEACIFAAHIYYLLGLDNTVCRPIMGPVRTLKLNDILELVSFLCNDFDNKALYGYSLFNYQKHELEWIHKKINKAVTVLIDWPKNFHAFLKNTKFKKMQKRFDFGLYKEFGVFYNSIAKENFLRFPFLKKAFEQYVRENFTNSYLARNHWSDKNRASTKYVNLKEAAEILETKEQWICRLLELKTIEGYRTKNGKRHQYFIKRASIVKLRKKYKDTYTRVEAANLLGVHHDSLKGFIDLKLIEVIRGPCVDGYPSTLISKKSIQNMFFQIDARIPHKATDRKEINSMIMLNKVYYALNHVHHSLAEIVMSILKGDITPMEKSNGKGLYAYRFDQTQVKNYLKNSIDKIKGNDLSVEEFALQNHWNVSSIYFLINKNFIESYDSGNIHVGQLINLKEIERFKSTYIFPTDISSKYHLHPSTVLSYLNKAKIKPVSGPQVDGGKKYLYLRKDLESLDLKKIKLSRRAKVNTL